MTALTLAQRVVAVHQALDGIPHAFGGAIALAYHAEPRATIDVDVNVFVGVERYDEVAVRLERLGADASDPQVVERVQRDGQVRVWWDSTPLDLFFAYDAFHRAAAAGVVTVPFADSSIPVLSATHLVVCKVVFDRPKDWVDVDAILSAGSALDPAEIMRWVGRIAGDDDPRYERLAALLTRR